MNAAKRRLAEMIDTWVNEIARNSTSDEQTDERILESMYDYMAPFKQLIDTCTPLEMTMLVNQYDGFYRFANLLERLAQGIQDGVISVPENVPMPANWPEQPKKKKRPRKPKTKRQQEKQQQQAQPQQIRRDITFLPIYTELIIGELAQTQEQYETFSAARDKPHVLDDTIIDRAVKAYEEQLTFIPLHEKQLNWWLSESLSDAQQFQVKDLKKKLSVLQETTEQLLTLLAELRKGTIDRILGMDDEELGRKILSGEIKPPF
jgi:transposase-like protein